jgi:hypothetical protein
MCVVLLHLYLCVIHKKRFTCSLEKCYRCPFLESKKYKLNIYVLASCDREYATKFIYSMPPESWSLFEN